MNDLTAAIFAADLTSNVNTFRQNLQVEYTERLIRALDVKSPYDNVAQGMINQTLNAIDNMMKSTAGDGLTKAHRSHVRQLIADFRGE